MPVGINGNLDGAVAHLFFHISEGCPVLNQQRSERVPKIMGKKRKWCRSAFSTTTRPSDFPERDFSGVSPSRFLIERILAIATATLRTRLSLP